jgi:hypothetical protein
MRFIYILSLFISTAATAQSVNNFNRSIIVEAFDIDGSNLVSLKKMNIEGSPYVDNAWLVGKVIFANGRVVNKLPIRFDLNKQTLQFRQDSLSYFFSDIVREFTLPVGEKNTTTVLVFRSGYPAHGQFTTNYFYNILVSGKSFHLVKAVICRLQDKYAYIGESSQQYITTEELLLFDVQEKQFIKIKRDPKKLPSKIINYNSEAKAYFEKNSLDKEYNLAEWVVLLNK